MARFEEVTDSLTMSVSLYVCRETSLLKVTMNSLSVLRVDCKRSMRTGGKKLGKVHTI